MAIIETLIVDGLDLSAYVTCFTNLSGLYIPAKTRGENVEVPGVDGATWVAKSFSPGTLELGLTIAKTNTADFNQTLRTLRRIVPPGKKVSMQRLISYPGAVTETHSADGEYAAGLDPEIFLMKIGRTTLTMTVLGGLWYGPAAASFVVAQNTPANYTALGDTRTRKIVVTMNGSGTVTNNTNGTAFTYSGGTSATIDVLAMTAFNGPTNMSNFLTWSGLYPLEIQPGTNNLNSTATGNTNIVHTPAFL